MTLRGRPKEPFYMVGRMEGQSVVLRAENGKLHLMVDDEEGGGKQEMVYEVRTGEEKGDHSIEMIQREGEDEKDREAEVGETGDGGGQEKTEEIRSYRGGKMPPGGALGVDGETKTRGDMPGVGGFVDSIEPLAGAGYGGNAIGPTASGLGGESSSVEPTSCGIVGAQEQGRGDQRIGVASSPTPEKPGQARGVAGDWGIEEGL